MGMTIDEHIAQLIRVKHYASPRHYETLDMAIDTMRKYQQLQADYENRLKADLKAILVDLQLEIREHDPGCGWDGYADKNVIDCIIQQRINSLKVEGEPREREET